MTDYQVIKEKMKSIPAKSQMPDMDVELIQEYLSQPYLNKYDCFISEVDPELSTPLTFKMKGSINMGLALVWTGYATEEEASREIEYKINNGEWTKISSLEVGQLSDNMIPCVDGDIISVRGNNSAYAGSGYYNYFMATGYGFIEEISGNINSLISANNFAKITTLEDNAFYHLFGNLSNSCNISNLLLPATNLGEYCYGGMFNGCTLTGTLHLPAETGANAYDFMLNGSTVEAVECHLDITKGCPDFGNVFSPGTLYVNNVPGWEACPDMSGWTITSIIG